MLTHGPATTHEGRGAPACRMAKQDEKPDDVRNRQQGGRYGTAAEGEPHLAPEVAPLTRDDGGPAELPHSFSGALPENAGEDDTPRRAAPREEE